MRIQRLSGHRLRIPIARAPEPSAHSARTRIQLPYLSLVVMMTFPSGIVSGARPNAMLYATLLSGLRAAARFCAR